MAKKEKGEREGKKTREKKNRKKSFISITSLQHMTIHANECDQSQISQTNETMTSPPQHSTTVRTCSDQRHFAMVRNFWTIPVHSKSCTPSCFSSAARPWTRCIALDNLERPVSKTTSWSAIDVAQETIWDAASRRVLCMSGPRIRTGAPSAPHSSGSTTCESPSRGVEICG